jgi:hypothetical protein
LPEMAIHIFKKVHFADNLVDLGRFSNPNPSRGSTVSRNNFLFTTGTLQMILKILSIISTFLSLPISFDIIEALITGNQQILQSSEIVKAETKKEIANTLVGQIPVNSLYQNYMSSYRKVLPDPDNDDRLL